MKKVSFGVNSCDILCCYCKIYMCTVQMHRFGMTAFELKTDVIYTTAPEIKKTHNRKLALHIWTGFLFLVTTGFGTTSELLLYAAKRSA